MKARPLKFAATALLPAALLALTGCGTTPPNPLAFQASSTLAGGITIAETHDTKAVVDSIILSQRMLALRGEDGVTVRCKAAPQVSNFEQLQIGERVKATITDAAAIFPVKNGPPPSVEAGVAVAGSIEGGRTANVVLHALDYRARVTSLDVSYRLLTLEYAVGTTKTFKTPLGVRVEHLQKGDEVVVRTTDPLAICVEPR